MRNTTIAAISAGVIGAIGGGIGMFALQSAAGPALKNQVSESLSYSEVTKTQACQNYIDADTERVKLEFYGKDTDREETDSLIFIDVNHAEKTVSCTGRGHAFDHGNSVGCGFTYTQAKNHLDAISSKWDTAIDKVVGSGS